VIALDDRENRVAADEHQGVAFYSSVLPIFSITDL
jgi:hypothetical protein